MTVKFPLGSLALLGLALAAGSPGLSSAQDPKPGVPPTEPAQSRNIESKREKAAPIPDFARSFGLPFESMATLGHRLTDARLKCDPITLAMISTEIGIAEQVSGKKADITAAEVKKEAVELARMRRCEPELAAMSLMVEDKAAAKELTDLASKAGQEEAERVSRFKSGEREKGVNVLIVRNTTPVPVSVRVNGVHLGWVQPFSQVDFNTAQYYEPHQLYLSAHDQFGDVFRSHVHTGHHHYFTWTLTDQN